MRGKVVIYDDDLYFPLFVKGGTRYKVVMGGRGSAKSYTISTALLVRSYEDDGTILFTRYTLTNAEVSILPEFLDKIKRLDWGADFVQTGNDIVNTRSGGKILFRGIKTSTGINTAALKSIPKLKMWVNDESEELVDETVFDTIDLSIRYNNAPGEVWIVANPPDIDHFLYRRFFKDMGVEDVWNGVKDNVTYIHTTYLNNPYLPPEYVALAERCKEVDREKYEHIWLGHFAMHKEGLIYKGWKEIGDDYWPNNLPCWYGIDWGFANDPAAVVRVTFDELRHVLYVKELMYATGMLTADIARVIREDIYNRHREHEVGGKHVSWAKGRLFRLEETGTTEIPRGDDFAKSLVEAGFVGWEVDDIREWAASIERMDGEIYCDPARPEQIREMKINHGLWAMAAVNTDKVGRIEYLKYFDVRFIGENIEHEVRNYRWQTSKTDKTQYINKPQDGGDHLMDAISYGAVTHLRRLGIANKLGEK